MAGFGTFPGGEPGERARLPFADAHNPPPVIVAYGAGVDSTALIIERQARGERIDMALRAVMPDKPETLAHIRIFEAWMDARGIPHATVSYTPQPSSIGRPITTFSRID